MQTCAIFFGGRQRCIDEIEELRDESLKTRCLSLGNKWRYIKKIIPTRSGLKDVRSICNQVDGFRFALTNGFLGLDFCLG
jgi:hypothetical protein